jgi:hypothetical protein
MAKNKVKEKKTISLETRTKKNELLVRSAGEK